MSQQGEKNSSIIIKVITVALVAIIIAIIIWLLASRNESYISESTEQGDYSALECVATEPKDPFFVFDTAKSFQHQIKVIFTNGKVKDMSYRYDGTFENKPAAENAQAWLHGDYNEYMTDNSANAEILNPVFSLDNNKLLISLYAESKKIDRTVAKLFFISNEEYRGVGGYTIDSLKTLYESKNFTCKIHD